MAVYNSIALGKATGSAGNLTFTVWRGLAVAKQKPASVAQPASDTRTMRQSAVSQMVALFRLVSSVVNLGFKSLAVGMSAYNAFSSYNLKNAFDYSAPPVADILYPQLLFSKGTIANTPVSTAVADRSFSTIVLTFPTSATGAGQMSTDIAVVVAINGTTFDTTSLISTAARSTGTVSVTLPSAWLEGDLVHCYLSFASIDGKSVSDSVYVDATIEA